MGNNVVRYRESNSVPSLSHQSSMTKWRGADFAFKF